MKIKEARQMKYRIMMTSWGGTKEIFMEDLTLDEARRICEENGWEIESIGGGYIWDLEIEEMQ